MIIKVENNINRFIDKCLKYHINLIHVDYFKNYLLVEIDEKDYKDIKRINYFSKIKIIKYKGKKGFLYLLKKSSRFKNSVIAGFYIEKVLNNCLNIDKNKSLETLKKENLRLQGYTNSNKTIISLLDDNYLDSKMIKGLRFKNDGSFYSTSKVLTDSQTTNLIKLADKKIKECIHQILEADFKINPKNIDGKNVGCEFCDYKDICFMKNKDVAYLEKCENFL